MVPEEGGEPEVKRKKTYTKKEILEKLEECENDVKRAVDEIVSDISPFDMSDINVNDFEDKVERLGKVSKNLSAKVYKLKKAVQTKKFRHNPELLEEKCFSSSQYSVLQSEDSEDISQTFSQASLQDETERPQTYRLQRIHLPIGELVPQIQLLWDLLSVCLQIQNSID